MLPTDHNLREDNRLIRRINTWRNKDWTTYPYNTLIVKEILLLIGWLTRSCITLLGSRVGALKGIYRHCYWLFPFWINCYWMILYESFCPGYCFVFILGLVPSLYTKKNNSSWPISIYLKEPKF